MGRVHSEEKRDVVMPIVVQCSECDHEWDERPSMAGRSVECPECQSKNRVSRTAQRVSGQSSNVPRVVLIGSCIFLVGVLGMLAVKMVPIFLADDDSEADAPIVSGPQDPGTDGTQDADAVDIPDPVAIDTHDIEATQTPGASRPPVAGVQPMVEEEDVQSVINTDRGRELMAEMSDVGLKVTGFSADVRGTVSDAVRSAVSGAIEKCQVIVRAPNAEPIMHIALELRDSKLVMSARLVALDQQRSVRVWERSGAVTELDEKATVTGILPTNLSRDVETFFKSLRLEFNDARRQFSQQ